MADTTITQDGTTTPTTPPVDDLQINLEDAPKIEAQPEAWNLESENNLDLDLNLPEAPKDDDRLKNEDKKNEEATAPVIETPVIEQPVNEIASEQPVEEVKAEEVITPEPEPIIETPVEEPAIETPVEEIKAEEVITPEPEPIVETPVEETVIETPVEEVKTEEIETPVIEQPVDEITGEQPVETIPQPEAWNLEPVIEDEKPSTTIIEEPITDTAPTELTNDMKIIENLNMNANVWGLAPEAKIETKPAPVAETPKTFDLDAMLGTTVAPIPTPIETQPIVENAPVATATPLEMPPTTETSTPVPPPAFTIPTTTTQVPVQAMPQVSIPQSKTKGVKTLLFVVLFAALGFTTYFILRTMYPVEFSNMFWGDETQMHASEAIGVETGMTVEETTWTIEEELTGDTEDLTEETIDNNFGELNDIGTMTEEPIVTEETDLSKLTDYVNKGNELLEQGKAVNNNTVIKYGLYISKKATDFLTRIANGEEINNLSWYFAQFDQYISQLETILAPTVETPIAEMPTDETEISSPSSEIPNGPQDLTPTPEATIE